MMGLTPRQSKCLLFVERSIREHGFGPSFQEIASEMGLQSKSGVHRLLQGLEERGAIRRRRGSSRAIEVLFQDTATAWPIETAPKNGAWFLAFGRGIWARVSWGSNYKGEQCWCSVDRYWYDGDKSFTHWMPLPKVVLGSMIGGTPPRIPKPVTAARGTGDSVAAQRKTPAGSDGVSSSGTWK